MVAEGRPAGLVGWASVGQRADDASATEVYVTPDGNGTVTIVLPATTDCTATGAICTQDGRMLSTRLEITIAGPNG